jgi:carbon-monoxide dehydrogenase large subunit
LDAGKPAPTHRAEDPRLLAGAGTYLADLVLPDMLHLGFVRSPHAHARVRRVELGPAAHAPGVAAAIGSRDLSGLNELPILFQPQGQRQRAYALLATDKVHYVGQPIAAVAAESRYLAEDAADLAFVDYEPLPALLDVDASMHPEAVRLHDDWPDNCASSLDIVAGDPDPHLRSAPVIIGAAFNLPRQAACPLEGRGAVAKFDAASGELTLWVSNQAPHQYRTILARLLGLDEGRIRVIVPDVGGGFGVKLHYYPEEVLACILAMRLGRPVKWIEDRLEHFVSTVQAREQRVRVRAAFDSNGRLLAISALIRGDCGAHLHTKGPAPIFVTGRMLPGPYRLAHYRARVEVVVTNKVPFGAYRGFGMQQATFVIERVMDMAAARIGLDPAEIRRRNLLTSESMPHRTAGGFVYDSGDYREALSRVLAVSRYEDLRERQARARREGQLLGIGVSAYVEYTAMGPSAPMRAMGNLQGGYEPALVRVEPTGDVTVASGVIELGQGIRASLAQVAATVLTVPVARVRVLLGDTHRTPYSAYGTAASRGAPLAGGATRLASRQVRDKIVRIAAHLLEARVDDVDLVDGACRVRGAAWRSLPLAAIAEEAYRGQRLPQGMDPGLEAQVIHQPDAFAFPYGAHVAMVDVDPGLGTVRILGYWVVHDCGPLINPPIVEGQLRGAITQGVGAALLEALAYDDAGQPLATTLMDYLLPALLDAPRPVVEHMHTPSPTIPGGFKGMAEGGIIAAPAAVVNAVADALEARRPGATLSVTDYPVTPQRILTLLAGGAPVPR